MSTIVTRAGKGAPLTNTEMDSNLTNLNTDKFEIGGTYSGGTANTIPYLNGSKVLSSNTGIQFDGSNLGLGVTPSAWATITASQIKNASFTGYSNEAGVNANTYYNAGWKYIASDYATKYLQSGGAHYWFNAPSGTAGNAITFTQAMTLDASGNLIVGGTSPTTSSGYTSLSINNATNGGYAVLQVNGTNKSDWYVSGGTGPATLRGVGVALTLAATGANYLSLETNGSERARIDSSGNAGFGTTTPSTQDTTGARIVSVASGTNLQAMFTDASTFTLGIKRNSTSNGGMIYGTGGSVLSLGANNTESARFDTSGNFLVGKTAQSLNARTESDAAGAGSNGFATANPSGSPTGNAFYSNFTNGNNTACLHFYGRAGGGDRIYIYGNGNIVNSNNSYGALSDIKLKENITDATPKLEQLNQVRVVNYNLIGETQKQIGVIAQELEQIFPGIVEESPDYEEITTTDEDGNQNVEKIATGTTTKSVKYSVFVPMLIKAIQEQQAIIVSQAESIAQLQADVEALKGKA